jgi:demethylmenaquinone methyltransferase/2-methoxy-6-polyprenyl-1,4-benzoquinol methylase
MAVSKDPGEIRGMFGAIAPRYDLLNHLLSLSIDRRWRRRSLEILNQKLGASALVLDLCAGTADLALLAARRHRVIGCDFAHPMLVLAADKRRRAGLESRLELVEADALRLPFRDSAFDAVTIAFGFRNLSDYSVGLHEMRRALKPGGWLGILEFSQPVWTPFRRLYFFYFRRFLPRLGGWISGRPGAYSYLCRSVMDFPGEEALSALVGRAGFDHVEFSPFTGGIAGLLTAQRTGVENGGAR